MHNFSKLTPMSLSFINKVSKISDAQTVTIGAAKAIANKLPIPSFQVQSTTDHYKTTVWGIARSLTSQLNEVVPIRATEVVELVENFWKARYAAVFPPEILFKNEKDHYGTFMGFGETLPGNVTEKLYTCCCDLIDVVNGFTKVIGDITSTEKAVDGVDPVADSVEIADVPVMDATVAGTAPITISAETIKVSRKAL